MRHHNQHELAICQSGIQILAASALKTYLGGTGTTDLGASNCLIIHSCFCPEHQESSTLATLARLAEATGLWRDVVVFDKAQTEELVELMVAQDYDALTGRIRSRLPHANFRSVLCNNLTWQPENASLVGSYPSAQHLCYGDAVGIYFSINYFASQRDQVDPQQPSLRMKLGGWKNSLLGRNIPAAQIAKGYLVAQNCFEVPPFPVEVLDKAKMRQIYPHLLDQCKSVCNIEPYEQICELASGSPITFLLTSSFSNGRIREDLIPTAYAEFISNHAANTHGSVLAIKPHPKDPPALTDSTRDSVSQYYAKVVVLNDPNQYAIPFEIGYHQVRQKFDAPPSVIAFSSAALALQYLFDVPVRIGFGEEICKKYFYEEFLQGRIQHEHDLLRAQETIA